MADINKTIKALTEWIEDPNAMNAEIDGSLVSDALELLKAQQPRKVVYKMNPWTNLPVSFCPNCEEAIKMYGYGHGFAKKQKYCSYCGQAIDWDGGVLE